MSCKVVTRLNVILPEVRFAGVWRLDTHSWNAAQELPGMVDMVQQMQGAGLSYATLALKQRRSVQGGQTKTFIVPMLGVPASIEQLAAGGSRLGSLPSAAAAPLAEIGPATAEFEPPAEAEAVDEADDEVVDAELVDDGPIVTSGDQLRDLVTASGLKVLDAVRAAHGFAESLGVDLPPNLSAIEDPRLLSAVAAWARSEAA